MEYTVGQLAKLSGVSPRTIRFYDEAGLLAPLRTGENGYRVYGKAEVDRLQEILILRALGMKLSRIAEILTAPGFDRAAALEGHLTGLLERRAQLDAVIGNVEKTLRAMKGEIDLKDHEKFEGLGKRLVEENERAYGDEIREKYGADAVERSNRKVSNLTPADFERAEALNRAIGEALIEGIQSGDPAGAAGQRAVELHREWLRLFTDCYTPAYHLGLADLYAADARLSACYDAFAPGAAGFLCDAIRVFVKE